MPPPLPLIPRWMLGIFLHFMIWNDEIDMEVTISYSLMSEDFPCLPT